MKEWSQLTEVGQSRRLRQLALGVLEQYDLAIKQVRLLEVATNTLFRVDCQDGTRYALRVCSPGEHSLHDAQVELAWLAVLNEQTDLPVPRPITNAAGEYLSYGKATGVPEERRCVLFDWVPGRPIEDVLSPQIYEKLGVAMAQMHEFSAGFFKQPDAWNEEMRPMPWNTLFYYPEEPVVLYDADYKKLFPKERLVLIEEAMAAVEPLLQTLYQRPDDAMIIHGDLHIWNAHYAQGQIHMLDFEDLMWGYPIQDVAITLWYCREREDYADLRASFKSGYSSVRSWPSTIEISSSTKINSDEQIEALAIARTIMFINYAAHLLDEPEEYIERQCAKLTNYLAP